MASEIISTETSYQYHRWKAFTYLMIGDIPLVRTFVWGWDITACMLDFVKWRSLPISVHNEQSLPNEVLTKSGPVLAWPARPVPAALYLPHTIIILYVLATSGHIIAKSTRICVIVVPFALPPKRTYLITISPKLQACKSSIQVRLHSH